MAARNNKIEAFQAIAQDQIDQTEIDDLRKQWENDMDNNLVRFKYAAVLAHSPSNEDKREAILHLEFLINHSPEYLRDSLFYLAKLRFLMRDFDAARACAEELLRIDPDNEQIKNMHIVVKYEHDKQLQQKAEQERNVGIAVGVGLGVTALAVGLSFLLGGKRK